MKAFIIFRDRATYAQMCLEALAAAGLEPWVVDQGSTYEPALGWLKGLNALGLPVLWRGGGHPRDLWKWEPFRDVVGQDERYVVTDADCVPDAPLDWPQRLGNLLDECPEYPKAGLGLRVRDIPESYPRWTQVLAWERQFWRVEVKPGVFAADVDTTLALYRPLSQQPDFQMRALRTDEPYVARHLAWYEDYDNLTPELRHYHEHAEPGISYWTLRGRSAWND